MAALNKKNTAAEAVSNFTESFKKAGHPKRIALINMMTLMDARHLLDEMSDLPEGYCRLVHNRFETLFKNYSPNHYCFYRADNGLHYVDEIFSELARIKASLEEKSLVEQDRRSLRDQLAPKELLFLINFIDAVVANDYESIKPSIAQIRICLFDESIDVLRFAQFYAPHFLKSLYKDILEDESKHKKIREWMIIANDVETLYKNWQERNETQVNFNWLDFFKREVQDVLHYGTEELLFTLLEYVSENGVNIIRYEVYLKELLLMMVKFGRPTLFKQLVAHYKISNIKWHEFILPAAQAGEIALIEYLLELEKEKKASDPVAHYLSIIIASAKHGNFETYRYFFNKLSESDLKANPQWSQTIIPIISWAQYDLFKTIIDHPAFVLEKTQIELEYDETKDDEKMRNCLKSLTPAEQLIQKSLASKVNKKDSFLITKFLLLRYLKKLDLETVLNFKNESIDFSKIAYLYAFSGRTKKYLNFVEAFISTETNIRRFFFCFNFSSNDLDKHFIPKTELAHDSIYQEDKAIVSLFFELRHFANYFFEKPSVELGIYSLVEAASSSERLKEAHRAAFQKVFRSLDKNNLESGVVLYNKIKQALSEGKLAIDPESQLAKMARVLAVKVGEPLISTKRFNEQLGLG